MLALAYVEGDTCSGCNGVLSETTALDPWDRPLHRYKVEKPHRCLRCTALADAQEQLPKDTKHPQALLWTATEGAS